MKKNFNCYIDDGFLILPAHINCDEFVCYLNNLDKSVKYTF